MSQNDVTAQSQAQQPADDEDQQFDPGPPWLPWVVTGVHFFFLVFASVTIAVLNGYLSASLVFISKLLVNLPVEVTSSFCFGVLGGTICASRWVILSVGRKIYDKNRVLWQIMIPIHGGFLAIFILVIIKAGMLSMIGDIPDDKIPEQGARLTWFIMSMSFLAGFASKVVAERMEGMARAFFGSKPESQTLTTNGANNNKEGKGQT